MPKLDRKPAPWPALRLTAEAVMPGEEHLAQERPLDLRLDGETYAITLCSPGADRELALGLLFSEGRIDADTDIVSWHQGESDGPHPVGPMAFIEATSSFSTAALRALAPGPAAAVKRQGALNSACGACGKTAWETPPPPWLPESEDAAAPSAYPLDLNRLQACFTAMQKAQSDFSRTGGCHAAAAFVARDLAPAPGAPASGAREAWPVALAAHEDVGRHNVVDKVVGSLLAHHRIGKPALALDIADRPYLLCVSGRVAYEIVAKAYRAGFRVLAAVGAPSTLAVRHADAYGMALLGFCREGRATVYTHPELLSLTTHA